MDDGVMSGGFAGLMASLMAFFKSIPILYKKPPPEPHEVHRELAEILVAFPISFLTAYAFAEILALWFTSLVQYFVKDAVVSPLGAGLVIGYMGIKGLNYLINKGIDGGVKFAKGRLKK